MLHSNVELHNAAELHPAEGGGVTLQRVPEAVRKCLNDHAALRMLDATCTEVRFVIEKGPAAVTLRTLGGEAQVQIFFGEFQTGQIATAGQAPTRIPIETADWWLAIEREKLAPTAFSHRVCRLFLSGPQMCLLGVEGQVRPPRRDELPPLRYLAYGTSITQGAGSSLRHLCYAAQTARHLGADLFNLGVGSSAFCEPELADYVAAREDWDIATVEPTANMQHFPLAEYEERIGYWCQALLHGARPRPVAFITLMPQTADLGPPHVSARFKAKPDEHRAAMRRVVESFKSPLLHVVEGPELLTEFRGLGPDMLHPKDAGHIQIGARLAERLRRLL